MLEKISGAFKALREGESLLHAGNWKNVQLISTALSIVIGYCVLFVPQLGLTNAQIQDISMGIALIGAAINGYFTVATTEKIGFGGKSDAEWIREQNHSDGSVNDTAIELPISDELPNVQVRTKNSLNGGERVLSGK